jgi:hypothetical protein
MKRQIHIHVRAPKSVASAGTVGLLRIEPLGQRVEKADLESLRTPRTVDLMKENKTSFTLSPGKYLASVRTPAGKVLKSVFDVEDKEEVAEVVVGELPKRAKAGSDKAVGYLPQVAARRDVQLGPEYRGFQWSPPEPSIFSLAKKESANRVIESIFTGRRVSSSWSRHKAVSESNHPGELILAQYGAQVETPEVEEILRDSHADGRQVRGLPKTWTRRQIRVVLGLPRQMRQARPVHFAKNRLVVESEPAFDEPGVAHYALLASEQDDPASPCLLARLPGAWRSVRSLALTPVTVEAAKDRKGKFSLSVHVTDPDIQSLLGFIRQGDLESALVIVDDCVELLRQKEVNPYAAAAAGYVLLNAPPERTKAPWADWIGNLGRWFGDLPDGLIQQATLLLQSDSAYLAGRIPSYFPRDPGAREELAEKLLLKALSRGLPVYRAGLRLLTSNLRILANSEYLRTSRSARAYDLASWLLMRVESSEAFTVLDITDVGAGG